MAWKKWLYKLLGAPAPQRPTRPTPPGPAAPRWFSLPGQRMELLDSGFAIELGTGPGKPVYTLFSPEGVMLAWGADLQAMQTTAERLAQERQLFACRGGFVR
jgi:hypothetical protein